MTVADTCKQLKMSRQNYYKHKIKVFERSIDSDFILKQVRKERYFQPCLGCRKLLYLLNDVLKDNGISLGRDRFFDLLREHGLLIEKKKKRPRTTDSRHNLPLTPNLIKDIKITAPNQVWCSDLTYIRTDENFMYAALITDMHSRKIVGMHIGDSLESIGCVKALEIAAKTILPGQRVIHHSDRGCQYCCHQYMDKLNEYNILASMTEANHCYENAMAERVNGILKQEFELDQKFRTKKQAIAAFYQAIEIYNNRRPHMSLNYRTPAEVFKNAV